MSAPVAGDGDVVKAALVDVLWPMIGAHSDIVANAIVSSPLLRVVTAADAARWEAAATAIERVKALLDSDWIETADLRAALSAAPTTEEQARNAVCPHGCHFGGFYCEDCAAGGGSGV
jgi:hypothetical protein